jgi:thiol-disulfide isomerase/thioredoxin
MFSVPCNVFFNILKVKPMFPYRLRTFFLLLSLSLFVASAYGQQSPRYTIFDSLSQLQARIQQAGDNTTLVINFWATWCKPCVEELAWFDKLHEQYGADKKVQVLLVSLDFKSQLKKRFEPFLNEKQLKPEIVLFADQDANTWIPLIHEKWDGAIPATLILRGKTRLFHLGKFNRYEDLENFAQPFLGTTKSATVLTKE